MLFCCNWFVRFRKLLALCCFTCAKMRAKNRIKINQNSDCCFAMRLPLCVFSAASRFVCHVAIRLRFGCDSVAALRFGCCFAIRLLFCDSFAALRFANCQHLSSLEAARRSLDNQGPAKEQPGTSKYVSKYRRSISGEPRGSPAVLRRNLHVVLRVFQPSKGPDLQ